MKKLKLNLVMIAAVLGIAGAFTTKAIAHKAGGGTSYYWFTATGTPSYLGHQDDVATEEANTGCNGLGAICERGYLGNQFNITNDPTSGVKSSQVNMDVPINQQ